MALSQRTLSTWLVIHKWTSLIATLFLLLLCVTGLPLIFHEEIDALTHPEPSRPQAAGSGARADLSNVIDDALAADPGNVPVYLSWDDTGETVYTMVAPTVDGPDSALVIRPYDGLTGARLEAPPLDEGVMHFLFELHANLLLGTPGQLLLGLVGLVFIASIVSGVVVYAPFMRRLPFGTLRRDRSTRVRWLDTHNLTGIVTTAWVTVVSLTGFILAMELPITWLWQSDQLSELTSGYESQPVPDRLVDVDQAISVALEAKPDTRLSFVAWPGSPYSSRHHYLVALLGTTPLTSHLPHVALVDAATGELTALRDVPWYIKATFVSAPLHFGDYGSLPMKVIWALLDIAIIVVLVSGLALWRRRMPVPAAAPEGAS